MGYKKLDNVDKHILTEMYKDGTQNPYQLSTKIKKNNGNFMSHVAIGRRIKKLQEANILKIQGNINYRALKFKVALFFAGFKDYNFSIEFLEKHANCPRIFFITKLSGEFQLLFGLIGKNLKDLSDFINSCFLSNSDLINKSSIVFSSESIKPVFNSANIFDRNSRNSNCVIKCNDCVSYQKELCKGCVFF